MPAAGGKRRLPLPGFHARPLKRLKEIETLTRWRQRVDGYTAPHGALAVAGHALAALEGMRRRNLPRHPGFDFATADEFLTRAGIDLTSRDIVEIVDAVGRSRSCEKPFVMTAVEAGKLLNLTRDERTNLGITTIEAIDEAPADRAARTAEWKRLNDRLRRRRATDKRRADAGLPPLDRTGTSEPETKPWEAVGMTKPTYYRRKAKGTLPSETGVSRTYSEAGDETAVSRTYTAASETGVSRTFRRNIEVVRHGSLTSTLPAEVGDHSRAAPERAASVQRDPQVEMALLMLLGRGDPIDGRQVAALIAPERIMHWSACLRRGSLDGDERIELEYHAIQARQTMRKAS